jgi:hypothetical protein
MFGLAQISKMNSLAESAKMKFYARSLNAAGGGHPKDAEKGRKRKKARRVYKSAQPNYVMGEMIDPVTGVRRWQ